MYLLSKIGECLREAAAIYRGPTYPPVGPPYMAAVEAWPLMGGGGRTHRCAPTNKPADVRVGADLCVGPPPGQVTAKNRVKALMTAWRAMGLQMEPPLS